MSWDPRLAFLILVFAAVFTAGQALFGLLTVATQKRKLNQRLKVAEKVEGVQALVMELRKQRGLSASGEKGERLRWLSDLIVASGVKYEPRKWITLSTAGALGACVAVFILSRQIMLTAMVLPLVGLGGPLAYLKIMAGKRHKALGEQLPQALEIVVRSLEAGHPVPTAIGLVAREMQDPIGTEFGMAADEIAYGATLEQAVARMAERCKHGDMDLFAATVRLQERAGGNLTGLLKLNANTIRERLKMRLKIKAASSEGRASATILTAAPFCAVGLIMVMSPKFYGEVIDEPMVKIGLGVILFWMFVGNMVMRRMIDMRI
ncbi:type II secretion system F family protein [Phenylobacterium deserti]|uniref:Pilus assembly protein TadB n=1 Tax=Phenylobacterium deserti TaxID=1914756 RepID=A0A328ATT3_9CAUL|nr:type II secretion system F family protein [Phenylobacterium deserti]RAK56914.1 pilus assembly protein TadB [Phenylobacterium deserti]